MADYSALDRALVGDKCSVVHQRVLATLVHTDWLPLLSLCQPTSGPKTKIMLDGNMTMRQRDREIDKGTNSDQLVDR